MGFAGNSLDCPSDLAAPDSLFEQGAWFYAMCREYLFRDHTKEIARSLFPAEPGPGTHVLELGCGPGFYACRLAAMYPQVSATGVDLSDRLIERAKMRAARRSLENCRFCRGDAQALPELPFPVDAVILSRLFLIVPDKQAVLSEVFRILRPGGRCFIAEPTSELRTRVPLSCLWLLAKMRDGLRGGVSSRFREPRQAEVMSRAEFAALVHGQPWTSVELVHDGWYQYAVCAKAQDEATTFADPASGASGASGD